MDKPKIDVASLASFIGKYGELGAELLSEYSIEEAERLLEENYYGAFDSKVDFVYSIFEECYSALPENLKDYFDFNAFARDLFIDDYFSVKAEGKIHVFSSY